MNFLGVLIAGVLVSVCASLVGRALLTLGIGLVVYTGVQATMTAVQTAMLSAIGGLDPQYQGIIAACKVGVALNIILTAFAVRMTLDGLGQDGTIAKWVVQKRLIAMGGS